MYIELFIEKIQKYNVVVITELHPMYFIDKIDKACRPKKEKKEEGKEGEKEEKKCIKLIYGMCLGLAGYVFTDFGPEHTIIQ